MIGVESALNLILSGKQVDAETARLLGILDRIASGPEALLDEARTYAYEPEVWRRQEGRESARGCADS